MAGSGQGRGWLLLVMLIVAVLLDARVMRLGGYARTLAGRRGLRGYGSGGLVALSLGLVASRIRGRKQP